MRKNIRSGIFFISIFYIISICFLMIMNMGLSVSKIELYDSDENKEKLAELKEEILVLESNSCTTVIDEMIVYYEKTSYDGVVELKEMYDIENPDSMSFLNYYLKLKDNCNITDEDNEKYDFPNLFITSTIQNEAIYQRYLYQYELGLKDLYFRAIAEPNINNVEYLIRKRAEIKVISNAIEMVKERDL